jgi:hypothetical protein
MFTEECQLWEAVILHSGNMPSPTQVEFQEHCLNADALCNLQNLDVCNVVLPFDIEDGSEEALMKAFQETDVSAVGNPRFCTIEEGGKHNCSVRTYFCVFLKVVEIPNAFVESSKDFQRLYLLTV